MFVCVRSFEAIPKGVGRTTAFVAIARLGIGAWTPSRETRLVEWSDVIRSCPLGRGLLQVTQQNIFWIRRWGSWRSLRHGQKLPVRGQRTHSNGSTSRKCHLTLYK